MNYKLALGFCRKWAVEPFEDAGDGFTAKMPRNAVTVSWARDPMQAGFGFGVVANFTTHCGATIGTSWDFSPFKSMCVSIGREFLLGKKRPLHIGTNRLIGTSYKVRTALWFDGDARLGVVRHLTDDVALAAFDVFAGRSCAEQFIDWLLQRDGKEAAELARLMGG